MVLRKAGGAALLGTLILGVAVSCELVLGDLPPVVGAPDGGGTGGARSATATTASATSANTTVGTATAGTATAASSTSGGTGGCCDCDGDHYLSQALCEANDCDDHDPLVHPGQTMYFATPSPSVGFDYDCSGTPEPEFPDPINCGLLMGSCDAGVGFLGSVPPCGDAGPFGSCQPSGLGLGCKEQVTVQNMVSRCR